MEPLLWALAAFLAVNAVAAMGRVVVGPTPEDRLVGGMLVTTTGVAVLLVLSDVMGASAARDVALVFVLLSALAAILYGQEETGPTPPPDRRA